MRLLLRSVVVDWHVKGGRGTSTVPPHAKNKRLGQACEKEDREHQDRWWLVMREPVTRDEDRAEGTELGSPTSSGTREWTEPPRHACHQSQKR